MHQNQGRETAGPGGYHPARGGGGASILRPGYLSPHTAPGCPAPAEEQLSGKVSRPEVRKVRLKSSFHRKALRPGHQLWSLIPGTAPLT